MLWWTGLQADRHEMEDGHATAQVAALVNNKTGIEWKDGKAHEGRIGRVIPWKMPSTPCAATQNFHLFLPLNAKRPGASVAGGQGRQIAQIFNFNSKIPKTLSITEMSS
jgi:hypothetical protein